MDTFYVIKTKLIILYSEYSYYILVELLKNKIMKAIKYINGVIIKNNYLQIVDNTRE